MSDYRMSAEYQRKVSEFVRSNVVCCLSTMMYEIREVAENIDDYDTYLELIQGTPDYEDAVRGYIDDMTPSELADFMEENVDQAIKALEIQPDLAKLAVCALGEDVFTAEEDDNSDLLGYRGLNGFLYDNLDCMFYENQKDVDRCMSLLSDYGKLAALSDEDLERMKAWYYGSLDTTEFGQEHGLEPEYREAYEFWNVDPYFGARLREHGETVCDYLGFTVWARCCTGQAISMDSVTMSIFDGLVEKRKALGVES